MNNERIDFVRTKLAKFKDKNGFVTLEATPTRVGVLKYQFNGEEVRELRHPDDVFDKESMDSLAMKPFTLQHEGGILNPFSVEGKIKGSTGENIREDGEFIKCKIAVFDDLAQKDIEDGKAVMLSAGYTCDTVDEQGEYEGERYDRRQVNIRYNHVSGVELGRAGGSCQLRLDSESAALISGIETPKKDNKMGKLKLEKVEFNDVRLDSIEVEEADGVKSLLDQRTELIEKLKETQTSLAEKDARIDGLSVELEESKKTSKELVPSSRLDALVEQRAAIMDIASASGYEISNDGSFEEINKKSMVDLLSEAGFKSDRLDSECAYLEAAWDQWTNNVEQLKATLRAKQNTKGQPLIKEYNLDYTKKPLS